MTRNSPATEEEIRVLAFYGEDAGGLQCECGELLSEYELRIGKKRQRLICCRKSSCGNSARATAKILHVDLADSRP